MPPYTINYATARKKDRKTELSKKAPLSVSYLNRSGRREKNEGVFPSLPKISVAWMVVRLLPLVVDGSEILVLNGIKAVLYEVYVKPFDRVNVENNQIDTYLHSSHGGSIRAILLDDEFVVANKKGRNGISNVKQHLDTTTKISISTLLDSS